MRLFAAVPVPADLRAALGREAAALAELGWPVRWTRPETIHLTLRFFGEVDPAAIGAIESALADAVQGAAPIALTATGLGLLPRGRPRVVYAALEAAPGLELLQHAVERAVEPLGFAPEGRPFRPHLTLGRVRDGARLRDDARRVCEAARLELPWLADRLVLYESRAEQGGHRHDARSTFTLAG